MDGDDQGTLNVHVIRNGQMNAQSIRFTDTDDKISFKVTQMIDIDGRGFTDSDMVEVRLKLFCVQSALLCCFQPIKFLT